MHSMTVIVWQKFRDPIVDTTKQLKGSEFNFYMAILIDCFK